MKARDIDFKIFKFFIVFHDFVYDKQGIKRKKMSRLGVEEGNKRGMSLTLKLNESNSSC